MKRSLRTVLLHGVLGTAALSAVAISLFNGGPAMAGDAPPREGAVAVVELFTSEGCSSCPPADVVLSEWAESAKDEKVAVYPISFHVDYWDRLGWRDPFSAAWATNRQRQYADALASQVYTPQMVVNGQTELVGSDRARAKAVIAAALTKPATVTVSLTAQLGADRKVRAEYSAPGAPAGAVINLVAVESGLTTNVPRGENAGRKLHHENVARVIETVKLDRTGKGEATLQLPEATNTDHVELIAYVQDAKSLAILGASKSELKK